MHDDETTGDGLRERLSRSGEDALGRIAQDLLENPLVSSAISRAFEARERAGQAQEAAMGALNIPSAADIERLTRRVRSLGQRLEGIEDGVDRLDERVARQGQDGTEARLAAIEERLAAIETTLAGLARGAAGKRAAPAGAKRAAAKKPAARKSG
ncbi:MAG TPA: hypothetical protein VMT10_11440 [Solirubrobacteraceae bacterium]|nr:hypothetical protein [Solirubrobacteraceae bacterium]